ncbi:MAG: rRNA maturation RNase YbeY [Candidatus Melainabacteria bacterium]
MLDELTDICVYNEAPFQWSLYASPMAGKKHSELIQQLQPRLRKLLTGLIVVLSEHEPQAMRALLDCHTEDTLAMCLDLDITLITDEEMRALNKEHRGKDESTDVLSFPLFEDPAKEIGALISLPFLTLGSIMVSLDWALAHWQTDETTSDLPAYLLERIAHGCLHVLGIHHDTQEDYERVKSLQANILQFA